MRNNSDTFTFYIGQNLIKNVGSSRFNLKMELYYCLTLIIMISFLGSNIVFAIPTGTLDPETKKFGVNNMTVIAGDFDSSVVGKIKNISNETLFSIEIVLDSYTKNNQLISVDEGFPSYETLRPGETSSFEIGVDDNVLKNLDHYVVGVKSTSEDPSSIFDILKNNISATD